MSEKTLGQVAKEAFNQCHPKGLGCGRESLKWQAAADIIAAPLLARIAEMEEQLVRDAIALRDMVAVETDRDELRAKVERLESESNWWLQKELSAYQRGVAEERERAFTAGAIFGWDACENNWQEAEYETRKQDAIRSASPAVDVTSGKGGER